MSEPSKLPPLKKQFFDLDPKGVSPDLYRPPTLMRTTEWGGLTMLSLLLASLFPPYFILYDQTLMAIPLVMLWSSPAWRWGVALFATTTVLVLNLSLVLGFSLSGFAALAAMFFLTRSTTRAGGLLDGGA